MILTDIHIGGRGGSRIIGRVIQGTNCFGGDVFQHAKHAGTRGFGPQKNFKSRC